MNAHDPELESLARHWEIFDWRNGLAVLRHVHAAEWREMFGVISAFRLKHADIAMQGRGNKSEMAGVLDHGLYALGWRERQFATGVVVDGVARETPTHKVDCFKGKVALEVEWNNKDPFFDRDLNNFRLLFDLGVVDVGVIVTRTTDLQGWLHANYQLFGKQRGTYGSSTTHSEKLYPRIRGGGAGGCPVVVFALRKEAYLDDRASARDDH
ncbi:MAG: restriction endonuclease [Methylobacteriaceae bacterium]|nr:restriction endonuclease [Methylobacteriaceae bacterium]